jgi:hypothetical protein
MLFIVGVCHRLLTPCSVSSSHIRDVYAAVYCSHRGSLLYMEPTTGSTTLERRLCDVTALLADLLG